MALSRFILIFVGVLMTICNDHVDAIDQVCTTVKYTNISDVRRSTANEYKQGSGAKLICDMNFIKGGFWYRFVSLAGNEMPTSDPGFNRCGTYAPIWMNGSHPTVAEGVVNRKACASIPFVFPVGCGRQYDIKVVNCETFYLYQLKEPQQNDSAYCAGDKKENCSFTGDTLPVCPGVVPVVGDVVAEPKKEDREFVRLQCVWYYARSSRINVQFHVRWFGDEDETVCKIERKFNGSEEKEYLFDFQYDIAGNFNPSGYQLNKKVYCKVRARFIGGTWSKWKSSNRIFTGITVDPEMIEVEECGTKRRDAVVSVRPHLPIRRRLKIDIRQIDDNSPLNGICIGAKEEDGEKCQVILTEFHNITTPLKITFKAICALFDSDMETKVNFTLSFSQFVGFWSGFKFPQITVLRKSTKKRMCFSVTTGHFRTFDGRTFDFYGVGTFLLYSNDYYGTEVQTRKKSCGGGVAACNCGVAIKEDAYYKIFDMCQVQDLHDGQAWWQNPQGLVIQKKYLPDSKINGFFTTEQKVGSTLIYKINLPSGVMVKVEKRYWGLSTYVMAPVPLDPRHKNKGLCGYNMNGKPDDDFEGETFQQFTEKSRIRGISVFDYKGDKVFEEKLHKDCDKTIWFCWGNGSVIQDYDAMEICNPSEGKSLHYQQNPDLCDSKDKDCSTTGDTLPVCPGVVPVVEDVIAEPKKEDRQFVRLQCVWNYAKNASNVQFQVRWFGDESENVYKIERKFNGNEEKEYLFDFEFDEITGNRNLSGYQLNKKVYCKVRARFIGGTWSKWKSSNRIFTGITVDPETIVLEECGTKKRDVVVSIRPHLPIRTPLQINIHELDDNSPFEGICIRGEKPDDNKCQVTLTSFHNINAPLKVRLKAICALPDNNGERRVPFKIGSFQLGGFWSSFRFPEITVLRKSTKKKLCSSVTDPHFRTFDGRTFDFYGVGTFLLYSNDYYGTEVQTRQKSCGGGFAACNCGVAIKEQAYYKIFDMCQVQDLNDNQAWWQNPENLVIRKKHLPDSKINGFFTTEEKVGSSVNYEINLPSGVMVRVERRYWGLSTYVRAPVPLDPRHKNKGLCGYNMNGNPDDDFEGETFQQFSDNSRVHGKSIFDYKGDKVLEDKISEDCREPIWLCKKNNVRKEGSDAINDCFPSQTKRFDHTKVVDLCDNESKRRKRDLTPDDDTIDDNDDDIPPFNPPIQNITFVPTWPTPKKGLTKENVTNHCNKKLRYSKAGETCGNITGVDIDNIVRQCVQDIQITENLEWVNDNFGPLEASCVRNAFKNISLYKNSTNGTLELPTAIFSSLCPNDCSDHGTCFNSTCSCHENYTSPDCSISLEDSPHVLGIRKSGLCDVRRRPCRNVIILGFPLLDSEKLTCHVEEYKVIESVWTPKNTVSLYPGLLTDLTEVKCNLPASPVNIGDYGNEGVTAGGLKIAVSNNGVNASGASMLFISYDSVCQECNTTTGCTLKTNSCLIFGHCFAQNQKHYGDWCQQCLPDISTNSWTKRRDNKAPNFQTSNVFYAFYNKLLRVRLRANDPEKRTFIFGFQENATAGADVTKHGLFTWTPTTNDSTTFVFKVQDECGAYTVLNTTVVIKHCPCINNGECQPDYRDVNGSGNFTCLCKPGYNGTLCELDIDECLSSPCFNGTCNNTKPGFFCSCNPGYTGNLCETDINECSSSPCFLDVPCYDMVNTYRCGKCPDGYTGTGETCQRLDGKIDECIKNASICDQHAKCTYNNGSYSCLCVQGYEGDGKNCTDINECTENRNICNQNSICLNSDGSYSCPCNIGYSGDGKTNCTDINECIDHPQFCHKDANCTNTEGSYTCQCVKGYIGDGKICKENIPPQFTTSSMVYAILNKEFKILMKARDPEGQNLTYSVLSNGTIKNAQFSQAGVLTVSINISGDIYVKVEDEYSGYTIMRLQIIAFECPCKNSGECYQINASSYPVQKSDYECKCEPPFTGSLCEFRPDPCDEVPCFAGLKCSPAINVKGFTCEECPRLFTGDGQNCELKTTSENSVVKSEMTIKNQEWKDELKNKGSKTYKKLVLEVTKAIRDVYKNHADFSYVIISGFRHGSVIVEFELIFTKEVDNPLEPLDKVVKTGKLGNMTVEMANLDDEKNDEDAKILGLDRTIFIVVVIAVVLLLIITSFAIYRRCRRSKIHKKEKLAKKAQSEEESHSRPKGLLFQPSMKKHEEMGPEFDLQVFDNETVLDDDLKENP